MAALSIQFSGSSNRFFRPSWGLLLSTLRLPAPYGVGCILSRLRGWSHEGKPLQAVKFFFKRDVITLSTRTSL